MSMNRAKIIADPIPERYARGWHCLGSALKYKDGKPHTVNAFGYRLVVFQTSDGALQVLDAWCPHMGGDLSHGRLENDNVVCPFHGWQFDREGKAVSIPYCKRVPPKARVGRWATAELNEALFIWHDPDGNPPIPGQEIPRLEELDSPEYSQMHWAEWVINANSRELVDNIVDMGHFDETHQSPSLFFANLFEDHKATQVQISGSRIMSAGEAVITYATYYGPGVLLVSLKGPYKGHYMETIYIVGNTAIDHNSFTLHFGVATKNIPGLSKAENQQLIAEWTELQCVALGTDVAIWDNKVRIGNPMLCESDGPIYHARKWYDQFFQPINEADEASTRRYEHEIDMDYVGVKPELRHLRG